MIRFGVIGAGRIGKVHAATVAADPKAMLAYAADAILAAAAYANEITSFVSAIEAGVHDPKPSGFDGLQAQILAEAATVSCQTGKPVEV